MDPQGENLIFSTDTDTGITSIVNTDDNLVINVENNEATINCMNMNLNNMQYTNGQYSNFPINKVRTELSNNINHFQFSYLNN